MNNAYASRIFRPKGDTMTEIAQKNFELLVEMEQPGAGDQSRLVNEDLFRRYCDHCVGVRSHR